MPLKLINENVDIFELPVIDDKHIACAGTEITIGDLHANAMKLMYMLIKHGIASNINKDMYSRLVNIYLKTQDELNKNDLDEFDQILSKIEFNNKSLVRLIGDELADRGMNDYYILKILDQLNLHKVPIEIIVSNHGIEFIEAYETKETFVPTMLLEDHSNSMFMLNRLVEKKFVTRADILDIANRSYKPNLRALSYYLSKDKKELTIFSHAGIGLNTIESLAQKLEVEYDDQTSVALAQTIDKINEKFQIHVQENKVHELYDSNSMWAGYRDEYIFNAPFEFILWNRCYDALLRPESHNGYKINFVHGHDSREPTNNNIYNLDNKLGKASNSNTGDYTVLYSSSKQMDFFMSQLQEFNNKWKYLEINGHDTAAKFAKDLHKSLQMDLFMSQLQELNNKWKYLEINGHDTAAKFAKDLYKSLDDNYQNLTKNLITTENFKKICKDAIDFARPELEKHRGWKQLLGNLALAVVGVGVVYVIAGLINKAVTGKFLFFKTDSANKIDKLEQTIKCLRTS